MEIRVLETIDEIVKNIEAGVSPGVFDNDLIKEIVKVGYDLELKDDVNERLSSQFADLYTQMAEEDKVEYCRKLLGVLAESIRTACGQEKNWLEASNAVLAEIKASAVAPRRAVLGERFKADGRASLRLSERQIEARNRVRRGCVDGKYHFENFACECGATLEEFEVLSEKDRYGLNVKTVICRK